MGVLVSTRPPCQWQWQTSSARQCRFPQSPPGGYRCFLTPVWQRRTQHSTIPPDPALPIRASDNTPGNLRMQRPLPARLPQTELPCRRWSVSISILINIVFHMLLLPALLSKVFDGFSGMISVWSFSVTGSPPSFWSRLKIIRATSRAMPSVGWDTMVSFGLQASQRKDCQIRSPTAPGEWKSPFRCFRSPPP